MSLAEEPNFLSLDTIEIYDPQAIHGLGETMTHRSGAVAALVGEGLCYRRRL